VSVLVTGLVHHTRHRPDRYSFTHRHQLWLVDLASLPRRGWLRPGAARVRPSDHLDGDPTADRLRASVLRRVAASHPEVAARVDRVLLLSQARSLGHVFDPLSVFWCLDRSGALVAAVLEVHNTYGGQHTYVLRPDERGRARVTKEFHVSPFNAVEGEYHVSLHLSAERVAVGIRLHVAGAPLLTASVAGRCQPVSRLALLRGVLAHPLPTHRTSALIRFHGIRLWARRLPLTPPPAHVHEGTP
jgi:DUF1365 family protein